MSKQKAPLTPAELGHHVEKVVSDQLAISRLHLDTVTETIQTLEKRLEEEKARVAQLEGEISEMEAFLARGTK